MESILNSDRPGKWQVTGVGGDRNGPVLELRSVARPFRKDTYRIGDELVLYVVGDRSCVGYRAPRAASLHGCDNPNGAQRRGVSQCVTCRAKAAMVPCLRCTGLRCGNPVRRGECVQPANHAVYLASFGGASVKVGVARWPRRFERLREQGALAGVVIARDDGLLARRLEHLIAGFGIAERGRGQERRDALNATDDPQHLLAHLRNVAGTIRRRAPLENWMDPPEQRIVAGHRLTETVGSTVKAERGAALAGPVIGHVGRWVSFLRDGEPLRLDLGSLVGYVVEVAAVGAPQPAQYQLTLLGH